MKLLLLALATAVAARSQQLEVKLDVNATKVNYTVGDVLHNVHGTFKLTRGDLWVEQGSGQAGGELAVNSASGDSGSHARDSRMRKNILESQFYPEIIFIPDRIEGKLDMRGHSQFQLHGMFSIHGSRHELTMNVDCDVQGERVKATAAFVVPYVKWGMKNPSTLFLRVDDTVPIQIDAVGQITPSGNR